MAAFIFIFQYVSFERSVDAFHTRLPHLYRVLYEDKNPAQAVTDLMVREPKGERP